MVANVKQISTTEKLAQNQVNRDHLFGQKTLSKSAPL
jgi:hypothetical protein